MSPRAAGRLEQLGFAQVYDYVGGRKDWETAGLPIVGSDTPPPRVVDAISYDPPTARIGDRVGEMRQRLGDATQAVVLNDAGVIVGVMRKESWDASDSATVESAMRLGPATVRPGAALPPLTERMRSREVESVLVSDAEGRLIGVVGLEQAEAFLSGEKVESVFEACDSCPGWWRHRLRV